MPTQGRCSPSMPALPTCTHMSPVGRRAGSTTSREVFPARPRDRFRCGMVPAGDAIVGCSRDLLTRFRGAWLHAPDDEGSDDG